MSKQTSRRKFLIAAGAAVVVAGVGGAYYLMSSQAPPGAVTTTAATTAPVTTVPVTTASRQLVQVLYPDVDDFGIPDPHACFSLQDFGRFSRNVYDPLVEYDQSSPPNIIPALADTWDASPDGLTYTFHLHPGIFFHDGTEVTADAVVFSMNRMLTVNQGVAFLWAGVLDTTSTKAVDKYTVQFNLKKAFAPFLSTMAFFYIVNPGPIKAHIDPSGPYGANGDYATKWLAVGGDVGSATGSGGYVLREWVIGDHTRVERYTGYWRDWSKNPNPLDVVIAQKIPEEATLRQIMEKGGAFHMSPYRSVDYFKALENSPNVQIIRSGKPFAVLYFHINTTKPPLDDVHVRRALSYCFDYDQYVNNIRAGLGDQKCVGPLARSFWGHNDDITPYTLDLDKAKAELGQSRYTLTQLAKMPITYYYIEPIEFERQAGLLLAGNGQKAGLNMAVNTIPWMKYGDAATKAETTPDIVAVGNTAPYADPDGILYPLFHSTNSHTWAVNPTWWTDPKVDDLLDKARSITDQNQRADMYKEVQRIVNDAAPAIFAAEQASIAAADKHIRGIVYNWEYTFYPQWRFYWQ